MRSLFFLIFLFVYSCGYPDIDTVPDFKNLTLTKEESIDLCKLTNTDSNSLANCLEDIKVQE